MAMRPTEPSRPRTVVVAWLLVLLLLQWGLQPWLAGQEHDGARMLQLAVLPLACASLLASRRASLQGSAPFLTLGMLGLVLLGTLATLTARQPEIAAREWLLTLSLGACVFALLPRAALPGERDELMRWLLPALIATAAAYAVLELLLVTLGIVLDRTVNYWVLFAGFSNPRFFNHVQTVLIPLLAGIASLEALPRAWRRLAGFALAANAGFLLLLMGRASLGALALASLVAMALYGAQGRQFGRRLLLAFIAGGLMYLLLAHALPAALGMDPLPTFRDPGSRSSVEARLYLWGIALEDIASHPWLGTGPMHFADRFNGEAAHPHNIYLQVASEYGLPFFALLAALVLCWLRRRAIDLRHLLRQRPDPLAIGCFVAIIAALADGAFSGNFVMPLPQMWIVVAIALLYLRLPQQPLAPPRIHKTGAALATVALGGLLLGQCALLAVSWPEFLGIPTRIDGAPPVPTDSPDGSPGFSPHFSPRFWQDGWF